MHAAKVVVESIEIDAGLEEVGLTQELLLEALRLANLYRARLTPHHPRLYRYQVMSGETVAALRDLLRPLGWDKSDDGNYELTVNDERKVAIAVASGDSGTGNPSRTPSNRSPKGRHTVEAIEANRQADLFPETFVPETRSVAPVATWVLLHHVTKEGIRSELSLPYEIDSDGKIVAWSVRILLKNLDFDGEPFDISGPLSPDLDISVTRKSA